MSLNYAILVLENDLIEVENFVRTCKRMKKKGMYINESKVDELKRAIKAVREASKKEEKK